MFRAVIFDFDGVIADTERLHLQGFRLALDAYDISISDQQYIARYLGLDDREGFKAILKDFGVNREEDALPELMQSKARIFADLVGERVEIFPGVRELLAEFRGSATPLPTAIGSGALSSEIRLILGITELTEYFDEIVAADDVSRGKPDPETFVEACARLGKSLDVGLSPNDCLVIEDSIGGVAAGNAAGMKTVAVTNSFPAHEFGHADLVVSSLEELNPTVCSRLF
jgi:beta-phosphoglucomutase